MIKHFYAFGSICRGEVDRSSDVDLLACITGAASEIDTAKFSVYQHDRLRELWSEGNPFAWHLHMESRLLFASDGIDFLALLGVPTNYQAGIADCAKFAQLFTESLSHLSETRVSATFNLSCIFLAARNFATCYSLWQGRPVFSRKSPLLINAPLDISDEAFGVLLRARVLSTRGFGEALSDQDIMLVLDAAPSVRAWMTRLLSEIKV